MKHNYFSKFCLLTIAIFLFAHSVNAVLIPVDSIMGTTPSSDTHPLENVKDGKPATYFKGKNASFSWIGYDLGEPYVITQVGYASPKNYSGKMLLGIFEGANNPDFSDAIPFYMIKSTPTEERLILKKVNCSRGFRYVRYVGPSGSNAAISEMKFYGDKGEGDDSQLFQITNLPLVNIHTQKGGEITSKTEYLPGVMSLISGDGSEFFTDSLNVRGRGNGSWTFDQKPYKIKLNKKARLLDMPAKAKKWTLINCVRDKSMIRNIIAYEASRMFGMAYTPAARMVEVTLNGEYKGIYQLTDQIEVNKNRVKVTEMEPTDKAEPEITGGYLLEVDAAGGEACMFNSGRFATPITIHYPKDDEITTDQKEWIRKYYNKYEQVTFSTRFKDPVKGIPSMLDVESYLRRFLLGEFTANTDDWYSVYFYKERNDSLFHFGPIWDIDLGFENDTRTYPVNSYSTFLYKTGKNSIATGMVNMIDKTLSPYSERLKEIWSEVRNEKGLTAEYFEAYVDSLTDYLSEAQALHFTRWPVLNEFLALNIAARGSHEAETRFVKKFIGTRIKWMDNKVGLYPAAVNEVLGSGTINGSNGCIYISNYPENSTYQVVTVSGMNIETGVIKENEVKVPVTPGFYAVKVTTPNNTIINRKILIQ